MFTSPYPNAISNGLTDKNPCSNPHQLIKSGFARGFARAFALGFAQIWSAAFSAGKKLTSSASNCHVTSAKYQNPNGCFNQLKSPRSRTPTNQLT